jgi:hypothetical protein
MEQYGPAITNKSIWLNFGYQVVCKGPCWIVIRYLLSSTLAPYLKCCHPTNEAVTVPHLITTSDNNWDPTIYNNDISNIEAVYNASIFTQYIAVTLFTMETTDISPWQLTLYMQSLSI